MNDYPPQRRRHRRLFTGGFLIVAALVLIAGDRPASASPLEGPSFASLVAEGSFNWFGGMYGRNDSGFTLNDLRQDLGLPRDQQSWKVLCAVRPLEHHAVRVYGTVPQYYAGSSILRRLIVTRNGTYPKGSQIDSELRRGSFGFGYDLDFLVGPRGFAGLNGDVKYLMTRVAIDNGEIEDQLSVGELLPCLGAHVESRLLPLGLGRFGPAQVGGFARLAFGVTPAPVDYVDISMGLSVRVQGPGGPVIDAKVGYTHESYSYYKETFFGRVLEFKTDGIMVSVGGAF